MQRQESLPCSEFQGTRRLQGIRRVQGIHKFYDRTNQVFHAGVDSTRRVQGIRRVQGTRKGCPYYIRLDVAALVLASVRRR